MSKIKSKPKKEAVCLKCGKPGADHFVMTSDKGMKGPYHAACKP